MQYRATRLNFGKNKQEKVGESASHRVLTLVSADSGTLLFNDNDAKNSKPVFANFNWKEMLISFRQKDDDLEFQKKILSMAVHKSIDGSKIVKLRTRSTGKLTNDTIFLEFKSDIPGSVFRSKLLADKAFEITSPLTGTVLKVCDAPEVQKDQVVVVIEAMKMENPIHAPKSGKVSQLNLKVGDSVKSGQLLFVIQ